MITREYGINFETAFDTTIDASNFLGALSNSASRRMEAPLSPTNIPLKENNLSSRTMI